MDTKRPGDALTDVDHGTWQAIVDAIVADGPGDADSPASELTLEDRLAAVPGPTLAATLSQVDPSTLSQDDAITYLQATERAMAWLGDRQADALVAVAGRHPRVSTHAVVSSPVVTIEDESRSEIAVATASRRHSQHHPAGRYWNASG